MKKLFLFLMMALALVACSTMKLTPEQQAQRRAQETLQMNKNVQDRHFSIDIDYIYPQQGRSLAADYGYFVAIQGDTLNSCLPYYGRAYQVPYGGGDGLNFETRISSYTFSRLENGVIRVQVKATNDGDQYNYVFDIFDNGKTSIVVSSRERDQIRFTGTMNLNKKK